MNQQKYIIDVKYKNNDNFNAITKIESKILNKQNISNEDLIILLDYVVQKTRKIINDESYINKCDLSQSIICNYLNKLGIINYPNMTQKSITNNIIGHSFVIASFNINNIIKNFIIDPTYIQFLTTDGCNNNKYIIKDEIILKTPDPGYFIKDSDKKIISKFIENGYMELNETNAYIYGNSFYHTKTGVLKNINIGNINGRTFINSFLKGKEKLSVYENSDIHLTNENRKRM